MGLLTLKQRLRFWVGLIIVVLGALILISTSLTEARYKTRETKQQLKDAIGLQSTFINRWLDDNSTQIRVLSNLMSGRTGNNDEIRRMFQSFMSEEGEYTAVLYVDAQGKVVVDSQSTATSGDVSDREYFKEARAGRSFITDVLISKNSNRPFIFISSPVMDANNNFNGLVCGVIHIGILEKIMNQFDFGSAGETYLLNRSGQFITVPLGVEGTPLKLVNSSPIAELANEGASPNEVYANYAGERVLGQYGWVKDREWLVVAEMKHSNVFRALYTDILLMSIIVLVVLLLSFALTFTFTEGIVQPIGLLLQGTSTIREGDYDFRIPYDRISSAPEELQQLCENFNLAGKKLKSTIQMLEMTAVVDQLTEVYNRRFIMTEGPRLLETCIRAGQPCSVLMIDIDFFKKVNDTYGHLVGDRVIIHAASILMSCIRSSDMVSRYGGEEFLILVPNASAASGGMELGNRIRRMFMDQPYREEGLEVSLTVSTGVADYRTDYSYGTSTLEDMVSRADQALYKAKRNGRNRVEMAIDPQKTGPQK
ncbi:MAG: diguanylate cyclase [Magnetospirillum sp.]|nr:diguanylate cyclase [Magnetospirillum sp.]